MENKQEEKRGIIVNEKLIENYNFNVTIEDIDTIRKQMMNSVCQILKKGQKGTGFFCDLYYCNKNRDEKKIKVLITNNHVFGKEDISKTKKSIFYGMVSQMIKC